MSGQPTALDYINGLNYAYQQVNKMKCQDPEIVQAVCSSKTSPSDPGGGTCIAWQEDKRQMTFPVPSNYYVSQCTNNSDCEMGSCQDGYCSCVADSDCKQGLECIQNPNSLDKLICGYAPKNVSAGHCVFTNKTACLAQGQLPYDCTPNGCVPKENLQYPYTEWREDSTGGGKCVLGNFLLRQWCENPSSRCAKDSSGKYPEQCVDGANTKGVVDVPPFYYDRDNGMCYMTPDYCSHYERDYNKPACSSNSDCTGKNEKCVVDQSGLNQHCIGPDSECQITSGEKIADFTIGRTLFYMFEKHTTCKESYTELNRNLAKDFAKTPKEACFVVDFKNLKRKKILHRDFAGQGIHLYLFEWNKGDGNVELGFDPTEVEKVYPDIVETNSILNMKVICISREDIKDNNLKRIYLLINSRSWATELLILSIVKNKNESFKK